MRGLFLYVTLLTVQSTAVKADSLADVRAALSKLGGTSPVRASLQLAIRNQNEEDGKPEVTEGRTAVRLTDGDEGLVITYPAPELAKATAEQKAEKKDPEKRTPTRMALREVNAVEAAELLDYAPTLLTLLEGAQLVQEKIQPYGGKSSRLLILKLQPALSKSDKKRVKEIKYEMSLWIGADAVPIGAEVSSRVSIKFLLMTFRQSSKESFTYAHVGDRLLVTRFQEESSGSGMGQEFQQLRTVTLTIN